MIRGETGNTYTCWEEWVPTENRGFYCAKSRSAASHCQHDALFENTGFNVLLVERKRKKKCSVHGHSNLKHSSYAVDAHHSKGLVWVALIGNRFWLEVYCEVIPALLLNLDLTLPQACSMARNWQQTADTQGKSLPHIPIMGHPHIHLYATDPVSFILSGAPDTYSPSIIPNASAAGRRSRPGQSRNIRSQTPLYVSYRERGK